MARRIYLDHHATTSVDPRVVEAMIPYFTERFGNAASRTHEFGHEAWRAVEEARRHVAGLVGARPEEIVFTSGATESDNLAVKGVRGENIVTVATEHRAVLDSCRTKSEVTLLPVDSEGLVDLDRLRAAITERTALVSVMVGNNEIGVIQPIAEIGKICRERGVLFHSDAAQAAGILPIDVDSMGIDLLSLSAHKMYGPKGVGALFVRKRVKISPILDGGGHEGGLRSGTLPVPLIVGFGEAARIASLEMAAEATRIRALRDRLWNGIRTGLDRVRLNGHPERRLPGNLNVSFEFVENEGLIEALDGVAVSGSAACTTAKIEPSHVLAALGLSEPVAHAALRFGIGRFNTASEIDITLRLLVLAVRRLRESSPLYELVKKEA